MDNFNIEDYYTWIGWMTNNSCELTDLSSEITTEQCDIFAIAGKEVGKYDKVDYPNEMLHEIINKVIDEGYDINDFLYNIKLKFHGTVTDIKRNIDRDVTIHNRTLLDEYPLVRAISEKIENNDQLIELCKACSSKKYLEFTRKFPGKTKSDHYRFYMGWLLHDLIQRNYPMTLFAFALSECNLGDCITPEYGFYEMTPVYKPIGKAVGKQVNPIILKPRENDWIDYLITKIKLTDESHISSFRRLVIDEEYVKEDFDTMDDQSIKLLVNLLQTKYEFKTVAADRIGRYLRNQNNWTKI